MKLRYWAAGIVLALFGVLTARVVSPLFEQPVIRLLSYLTGVLLSVAGLALIIMGMGRPWAPPLDAKGSPEEGALPGPSLSTESQKKEGGSPELEAPSPAETLDHPR